MKKLKILRSMQSISKDSLEPNAFFSNIYKKITFESKLAFFTTIILGLIVHFAMFANDIHNPDTLMTGLEHNISRWEISLRKMGLMHN